jgi:hypothetical protein
MEIQLTSRQVEILKELLEHELRNLEIETIRTDSIEYHRMLQDRRSIVDEMLGMLTAAHKV